MFNIILGYIWHYLVWAWPYFAVIASLALVNISMFCLGRWVEHRKWRREIKNGNRLGELAQQQLKERDDRIKYLVEEMMKCEDRIERVDERGKKLTGLAQEMINIAIGEATETLQRRKRA